MDHLRRIVQALRTGAAGAQSAVGLSAAQLYVLAQLSEGIACSISDLARLTMTHQSSVSVVVAKLAKARFVRRTRSEEDGRAVLVKITPAGERMLERAPPLVQADLVNGLQALSPTELATLSGLFGRWMDAARLTDPAPPMFFEMTPTRKRAREE